MDNELTKTALAECESVIERGMKSFIEVGTALLKIRDERLYRLTFATFEDYCRQRWGWTHRHANRQIEAAQVTRNLGPIGPTPQTESQARELTQLPPAQQREAWSAALKLCANGIPTARQIAAVVEQMAPKRPSPGEARQMAIDTGASVLDSEGWWQPPVTIERENEVSTTLDLLDLIVGFPESDLLKYRPAELCEIFSRLDWQDKSRLRRVSLAQFIAWLTEFENEKNRNGS